MANLSQFSRLREEWISRTPQIRRPAFVDAISFLCTGSRLATSGTLQCAPTLMVKGTAGAGSTWFAENLISAFPHAYNVPVFSIDGTTYSSQNAEAVTNRVFHPADSCNGWHSSCCSKEMGDDAVKSLSVEPTNASLSAIKSLAKVAVSLCAKNRTTIDTTALYQSLEEILTEIRAAVNRRKGLQHPLAIVAIKHFDEAALAAKKLFWQALRRVRRDIYLIAINSHAGIARYCSEDISLLEIDLTAEHRLSLTDRKLLFDSLYSKILQEPPTNLKCGCSILEVPSPIETAEISVGYSAMECVQLFNEFVRQHAMHCNRLGKAIGNSSYTVQMIEGANSVKGKESPGVNYASKKRQKILCDAARRVLPATFSAQQFHTERFQDVPACRDLRQGLGLQAARFKLYDILKTFRKSVGAKPYTFLILSGPSGTGKSFLAREVAGYMGLNFLSVQSTEIFRAKVGESEKMLKDAYTTAHAISPCVFVLENCEPLVPVAPETDLERRIAVELLRILDDVKFRSTGAPLILPIMTVASSTNIWKELSKPHRGAAVVELDEVWGDEATRLELLARELNLTGVAELPEEMRNIAKKSALPGELIKAALEFKYNQLDSLLQTHTTDELL